jgi:serine phosphatase RsbU (regulator of sigma subunit)
MGHRSHAPLVLTLALLIVVAVSLVAGGILLRKMVGDSFRNARGLREARIVAADVLKEQLDEETGIRGYAVARQPILLAPYDDARAALPQSFGRLRAVVARGIPEALPALDDATKVNRRWDALVAAPILAGARANRSLELHGKRLIDRFRNDLGTIDGWLARHEALTDERAQDATVLVGIFSSAAVAAVVVAAVLFTFQQYRLVERLEQQRVQSENERRKSAEVRAALEAERRVAETLQEALSQRVFPSLPMVRFSATYVPAGEEAMIGGDWYDALQLPQERVFLAVGDVTGHGIDAVVAMSRARQLLISFALLDAAPDNVLERVNVELMRGAAPIITAISAVIDIRSRELTYAAAGHPPPVLCEPGHNARLLEFGSLPLGASPAARYEAHHVRIVPGTMIVLYTDGLIEYSRDLAVGEAALLEAVDAAARRPADDAAELIRERIFGRQKVSDDVAILTVRLGGEPARAVEDESGVLRRIA